MQAERLEAGAEANGTASVHASVFWDFYDEEFLQEAYRRLLKREIDPSGLNHYLPKIRAGESRYRVLYDLSRSKEFKGVGVTLQGLFPYRCMKVIRAVPVVGRLVQATIFLWRIDAFMRDLRALENHAYRLSTKINIR
jgi:hypothetical protein